jgi:HEAT repeat protein
VYWCFHCYAVNPRPSGPCVRCGREVKVPEELSWDDRLIWALDHPDSDRAMLAAGTLGRRRTVEALPALRRVVDERSDPFLAVAALRSAIAIAGPAELREWLTELASCDSFMVRDVAGRALAQARVQ